MSLALSGFSLIEVLISLLLLSFILLGFEATEVNSMRDSRAAYYFDVANNQLSNMYERLKLLGDYSDISPQVDAWNKENQIVLPQGKGQVVGRFPKFTIMVYWGDKQNMCTQNQLGSSGCITQHIIL